MRFIGIDLAGSPKNDTGFCVLDVCGEEKTISTSLLHTSEEILEKIKKSSPSIVAIDAPLTYTGINRECDRLLSEYGALPATLKGMEVLAKRGTTLRSEIQKAGYNCIEVYARATGEILGFHGPQEKTPRKNSSKQAYAETLKKDSSEKTK